MSRGFSYKAIYGGGISPTMVRSSAFSGTVQSQHICGQGLPTAWSSIESGNSPWPIFATVT